MDEAIKVVLLGDSGVGKSSLALRFVTNEFRPYSESTIGASFMSKTIQVEANDVEEEQEASKHDARSILPKKTRKVSLKIWDTAGQEKYHSLAAMYYRGAGAAIVVYDMCNRASFQTLENWMDEIRSNGPRGIVLAVCGNKSDLAQHRQVPSDDAMAYANRHGAFYMETSARDDINVQGLFHEIGRRVPFVKDSESMANAEDGIGAVNLGYSETSMRSCC